MQFLARMSQFSWPRVCMAVAIAAAAIAARHAIAADFGQPLVPANTPWPQQGQTPAGPADPHAVLLNDASAAEEKPPDVTGDGDNKQSTEQNFNFHAQTTIVAQGDPAFAAKYSGPNSLNSGGRARKRLSTRTCSSA